MDKYSYMKLFYALCEHRKIKKNSTRYNLTDFFCCCSFEPNTKKHILLHLLCDRTWCVDARLCLLLTPTHQSTIVMPLIYDVCTYDCLMMLYVCSLWYNYIGNWLECFSVFLKDAMFAPASNPKAIYHNNEPIYHWRCYICIRASSRGWILLIVSTICWYLSWDHTQTYKFLIS